MKTGKMRKQQRCGQNKGEIIREKDEEENKGKAGYIPG